MTVSRYATFSCMEKAVDLFGGRKIRSSGLTQNLRTTIVQTGSPLSILVAFCQRLVAYLEPLYLLQPVVLINIDNKTSSNSAVINELSQTRKGECDTQTVPVARRNLTDGAGVKRLNLRRCQAQIDHETSLGCRC